MNQRYVTEMYAILCLRYLIITKVLCGCELNCTENIKNVVSQIKYVFYTCNIRKYFNFYYTAGFETLVTAAEFDMVDDVEYFPDIPDKMMISVG